MTWPEAFSHAVTALSGVFMIAAMVWFFAKMDSNTTSAPPRPYRAPEPRNTANVSYDYTTTTTTVYPDGDLLSQKALLEAYLRDIPHEQILDVKAIRDRITELESRIQAQAYSASKKARQARERRRG